MLTTEQLRARAKFWREKAVEAKWESVSIAQDMLLNADAFDELAANREEQPVAWEIRYWNSGHNCWHDWERITAEQHAEMSVQHVTDNDYEFRILYDAPPAPAVPPEIPLTSPVAAEYVAGWNACRAAMLENIDKPAPQLDSVVTRHADQPVSSGYKLPPHVYRELVNGLRDTAVKFSGTEQLRERLNTALSQFIEPDHPHTRTVAPEGGNGA